MSVTLPSAPVSADPSIGAARSHGSGPSTLATARAEFDDAVRSAQRQGDGAGPDPLRVEVGPRRLSEPMTPILAPTGPDAQHVALLRPFVTGVEEANPSHPGAEARRSPSSDATTFSID